MGVFPLADTMTFFSDPPFSGGGNMCALVTGGIEAGRIDEVWWHPHPTNPRRNATVQSPINYIDHSPTPSLGAPGTDTWSRVTSAGRYIRRSQSFVYRIGPTDRRSGDRRPLCPASRHSRPSGMSAALEPGCRSRSPRVRSRWHPNAVEQ